MFTTLMIAVVAMVQEPESRIVTLDLSVLSTGTTHKRSVPGERSYDINLVNRAPAARYVVRFVLNTDTSFSRTLDPVDAGRLLFASEATSAGCAELMTQARAILAATDEEIIASLVGSLKTALAATSCSSARRVRDVVESAVNPHAFSASINLNGSMSLVVERFALDGSTPTRTWRVQIDATAPPSKWSYPNEAAWIIGRIVADVASMARFCHRRDGPQLEAPLMDLVGGPPDSVDWELRFRWDHRSTALVHRFSFTDSVFSPPSYQALARQLLGSSRRPSRLKPNENGSGVEALTDPKGLVLQTENQRISEWLGRDMANPQAHEEAALLIASFALREAAGRYTDIRLPLCRLTAHLAFAEALRGASPRSRAGILADTTRLVLLRCQRETMEMLDQLKSSSPAETCWIRALRLRATGDYRLLADPLAATLFERRECYRALMQRVSDGKAIAFLKDRDAERMPDWGRIALSDRISVGTGNRFAPSAVELELAEAREVFRMEVGQDLPRGNVIAALNTGPGLCIGRDANGNLRPRVIDRGAWGQSYQRHVANALEVADRHQRKMLSLFDAADRGWLNDRETFRELTLLPLVAVSVSENRKTYGVKRDPAVAKALAAELETACESCIPLWDTYPERLTTANWRFLKSTCGFNTKPRWEKRWYGRTPLRRTAFEVESRQTDEPEKLSPSWNDLPIIAPFDREIVSNVLFMRFFGKVSTAADFDQVFGKLAEYDVVALRERAKLAKEDPVEQTKTYARIAALDPDGWIDLAIQLAGQGRDDEAAVAFQRAVDEGLDRVTVSHEVGWLVDYYLDHGQTERALTVASDAISVYSAGGLAVGAHLMERLDRWDEAEKLYKLEAERYQDPVDLLGFYVRYDLRVGDARYREKAEKARGTLFPLGLTHARISDFERPPFDGVVVEAAAAVFEKYGLKKGHVIVAIDGYRVRDFPQYQSLRGVGGTAMATVIVWTGEEYKEIVAPLHRPHAAARFWTYEPEVLR